MIPEAISEAVEIRPKCGLGRLYEKKDLPIISKAIRHMKDRYHIGIEEAYSIVIDMQESRWGTHDLADSINEKLGSAHFKATPERVWGLGKALQDAVSDGRKRFLETYKNEVQDYKEHPPSHDWLFHTSFVEGALFNVERFDPLSRCLQPWAYWNRIPVFFINADDKGVMTDDEFSRSVLMQAGNNAKALFSEFGGKNLEQEQKFYGAHGLLKSYVNCLMSSLLETNISSYFNAQKLEQHISSEILQKMDNVDCDFLIDRVRRDKLDKQMKYRRMILQGFLSQNSFGSAEDVFQDIGEKIRRHQLAVDYWKAGKNGGILDLSYDGHPIRLGFEEKNKEFCAEEYGRAQKILDRYQFLMRMLKTEHHFVENFLG